MTKEECVQKITVTLSKLEHFINQFLNGRPYYFMNQVKFTEMDFRYLNEDEIFPLDSSKLLKLGISLGNLMKTTTIDSRHDVYKQRSSTSLNFNNGSQLSVNNFSKSTITMVPAMASSGSDYQYNILMLYKFLRILINFDIGEATNTKNVLSPIKSNTKQLIIERLEVNTKLDNLFTLNCVFKLIVELLKEILDQLNSDELIISNLSTSNNSSNAIEDYGEVLHQIIARLNTGLFEPVLKRIQEIAIESMLNELNHLNDLFIST